MRISGSRNGIVGALALFITFPPAVFLPTSHALGNPKTHATRIAESGEFESPCITADRQDEDPSHARMGIRASATASSARRIVDLSVFSGPLPLRLDAAPTSDRSDLENSNDLHRQDEDGELPDRSLRPSLPDASKRDSGSRASSDSRERLELILGLVFFVGIVIWAWARKPRRRD